MLRKAAARPTSRNASTSSAASVLGTPLVTARSLTPSSSAGESAARSDTSLAAFDTCASHAASVSSIFLLCGLASHADAHACSRVCAPLVPRLDSAAFARMACSINTAVESSTIRVTNRPPASLPVLLLVASATRYVKPPDTCMVP